MSACQKTVSEQPNWSSPASWLAGYGPTKEALLRYFVLRKAWEAGGRVEAANVVFLNAARKQFGTEAVESLYRKWTDSTIRKDELDGPFNQEQRQISGEYDRGFRGRILFIFRSSNEEPDPIGAAKIQRSRFLPGFHLRFLSHEIENNKAATT